jgi:hypothetical protein
MQRVALIKETQELIAKKAESASLKKIQFVATRKMGLGYPDRRKVFNVKMSSAPIPYATGLLKK